MNGVELQSFRACMKAEEMSEENGSNNWEKKWKILLLLNYHQVHKDCVDRLLYIQSSEFLMFFLT